MAAIFGEWARHPVTAAATSIQSTKMSVIAKEHALVWVEGLRLGM